MFLRVMGVVALTIALGCGPDPSVVTSIGISGDDSMLPGEDASFSATAFNAHQEDLAAGPITWASSNPTVAVVTESGGTVMARQPGTTTISATASGVTGAVVLTVETPTSPLGRADAKLVYNPALQRVMLFGGMSRAQSLGDLWSWDGAAWRIVSLTGPRRARAAVGFDSERSRLVVYGGLETQDDGSIIAATDTWEWDGSQWTQKAIAGPSQRRDMGGGFDLGSKKFVVYGGFDEANTDTALYDTWTWDGAAWTQAATSSPASGSYEQPSDAVYSAAHGGLLVVAGSAISENATTVLKWSAAQWTTVVAGPPASPPSPVAVNGAGELLIFDESSNSQGVTRGELWKVVGSAAPALVSTTAAPPDRFGASMAYDAFRDRTVLFGGVAVPNRLSETWVFDGTTWTQATQ